MALRGRRQGRNLFLRPLPLSCICHIVGMGGVCLLYSFLTPPEPVQITPEIQVEMVAAGQLESGSGLQGVKSMPAIRNPVAAPVSNLHRQIVSGENAPADADPARADAAGPVDGAGPAVAVSEGGGGANGKNSQAGEATGTLGSSAGGDSGAAVTPSEPAPTESLGSIAARFAARVEANKEYPYMAIKRGQSGVVSVTVTLFADGGLESVYVSGSAGVGVLDNAALQAVRSSCPFSHGAGRSITMTVPIHYDLQ